MYNNSSKPLPYDLVRDGRKIKYRCRRCGADLSYYNTEEKFCHVCGGEIDWNVPLICSAAFRKEYNTIKGTYSGARLTTMMTNLFYNEFKDKVGVPKESQKTKEESEE